MADTLALTQELMRRASISPEDGGCQDLMIERLEAIGFSIERLPFGPVRNFWATRGTTDAPTLCLAGHTDVVPTGPLDAWHSDPFAPSIRDGAQQQSQAILLAMQKVRDRMIELEDFNEAVELLRNIVEMQKQLHDQTQQRHKEKIRDLLKE